MWDVPLCRGFVGIRAGTVGGLYRDVPLCRGLGVGWLGFTMCRSLLSGVWVVRAVVRLMGEGGRRDSRV